ncbi:hypothetical protein DEU56DRAFT_976019 [Suillus clintonianus]|uniref:uncharacterized protein n=1 Tax=Suillus clintonianus TaxID=1904413 RepID=UPI001B878A88|nr:uncharacterized protein DEU56DRAFT_976019 [Suillus clintonianus]KAG2155414.1 hypothetical protein DEU56DRAFT_976019 [Suillus clintonianus]
MANIDNSDTGLTVNHAGEEPANVLLSSSNVSEEHSVVAACPLKTSSSPPLISPTSSSAHSRIQPPLPPSDSSFAAPHPKKFTSVNINKKFLQKNSSSSGSATTSLNHVPVVKSGSPAPIRPVAPPISSHSRLVTTKLTAAPVLSTTTGPGWSRPSSATPPVSSTPSTSSNGPIPQPLPHTAAPAPIPAPAAPQLPVAGKVIQPQPRAIASTSSATAKKDTASKPAWGHPKVVAPVLFLDSAGPSDFPTAAEVAHGRPSPKVAESPKPSDAPHSKTVTLEEADAFRGVHLDPNTHHWDEMEEDDDHFLDGVIEFGDGRQYKISPAEASAQNAPSPDPATDSLESHPEVVDGGKAQVSKEDRFADDFDRRWPRSRPSPSFAHKDLPRAPRHPSMSPASSHPSYSPSEGSRVLFNERSNRLEPYSSHPHIRHLPVGPVSRRGSHMEHIPPPMDMRSGRDGPLRSPVQPVQLLQKPAGGYDRSSRTLRNGPGPHPPFDRTRDGLPSPSTNGPPGWGTGLPSVSPVEKHEVMLDNRGRRLSNMGPPPLPSSLKRDATRQLPPRISTGPPGKLFSRDPHQPLSASQQHFDSPTTTHGGSVVAQSPLLSTISVTSETPAPFAAPMLSIEDVHKTAMHISAERAKQRRQVEEEEREKEKERARQKAAALEEKCKVDEDKKNAQEAEAIKLIQEVAEAVKSPSQQVLQLDATAQRMTSVKPIGRLPSLRASARPPLIPRSIVPTNAEQSQDSSKTDSWRSKAPPPLSPPAPREIPAQPRAPAPLLQGVEEFISVSADEDLEVVDFSDMGKLVGAPTVSQSEAQHKGIERPSHPPRPVASDFFEDSQPQTLPPRPESPNLWRRKAPIELVREVLAPSSLTNHEVAKETGDKQLQDAPASLASSESLREVVAHIPPSKGSSIVDGSTTYSSNHTTLPTSPQRLTRPGFREAPMSTLDDTISRIKGALHDMKETEFAKQTNKETADAPPEPDVTQPQTNVNGRGYSGGPKWLPPALRPRRVEFGEENEVFDVTSCEPPRSPRLTVVVRLPSQSRPLEPIPRRQYHALKNARLQIRWDIMSWDPPVDGMTRKDFSLNDVLFKSYPPPRGKPKFRVLLPQARHHRSSSSAIPLGPKVNLPAGSTKPGPSFGRSKVDDLLSWRRVAVCPSIPEASPDGVNAGSLDTISCSPPPDPPEIAPAAQSVLPSINNKAEAVTQRPRAQPKMPVGSAVAFYREIPSETACQELKKNSVSFTVFSELDEIPSSPQSDPPSALFSSAVDSPDKSFHSMETVTISRVVNGLGKDTSSPRLVVSTQLDSKSSDESVDRNLITPGSASYSTPWTKSPLSFSSAKESPARAPDPEHLKAVWSQPSDKAPVHAVNSLEGIADDLTALPFTLQDVKSEDGETPPPTSAANVPSKMSLHDVTRAFQQVPTSSNATTRSSSTLPSSSPAGPISRPSSYTYGPVHPPSMSIRPPYPYPPMMAHSPSPTPLVYPPPSPAPRVPVNGHSPMFSGGQPIWVPLPPTQSHSGAVRPVASPYPTQLMAYPPPNGVPSMYGPPPISHGPQSPQMNGAAQPRPRNMMSPVLHPATPSHSNHSMYAGSPVMMHALPMMTHGPQPYMAVAGRGQGRPDGMPGMSPMQQSHSAPQSSHATMYSPAQPLPYGRPSW